MVAYLLLILQSTVLEIAPVRMAAPSLGLLVVLYVGISPKWTISAASIVALCTGYLLDLVSGAPQGVHALVFILVAVAGRALSTRVAVQGIVLSAAASFVASLFGAALVVMVRAQVAPESGYGGLRQAPVEALSDRAVRAHRAGPVAPHRWQAGIRACPGGAGRAGPRSKTGARYGFKER